MFPILSEKLMTVVRHFGSRDQNVMHNFWAN